MRREEIVVELIRRLSGIEGVSYVARNPKAPPSIDQLPAITIWELTDNILKHDSRGRYSHHRKLSLVVEWIIDGTAEGRCSKEAVAYADVVRGAIFVDGISLGQTQCEVREKSFSRVLRPPAGDATAGLGMELEIEYIEAL